ncbi:MAG TPA: hypothetical protein VGK74_24800 [Symbiobacteriaceae bacterium]|jgi:hypothetical protein
MNWWQDAEAQALRVKTPAAMAQTLQQRLKAAGIDEGLAFTPAYDLAQLYSLCADLVKLVDSALAAADGDTAQLRRYALLLARWADYACTWTKDSFDPFNQLMDSLELEPDALAAREAVEPAVGGAPPEEEPKLGGRYQNWHLLYERLDLKLASAGVEERIHRGLARSLARIYEHCLLTLRLVGALTIEPNPRFRNAARLLLEINTTWHFDLGPYHLGHGRLSARNPVTPGLKAWLFAMLQA